MGHWGILRDTKHTCRSKGWGSWELVEWGRGDDWLGRLTLKAQAHSANMAVPIPLSLRADVTEEGKWGWQAGSEGGSCKYAWSKSRRPHGRLSVAVIEKRQPEVLDRPSISNCACPGWW